MRKVLIIVFCLIIMSGCALEQVGQNRVTQKYYENPSKAREEFSKYDSDYSKHLKLTSEQEARNDAELEKWKKEHGYQ